MPPPRWDVRRLVCHARTAHMHQRAMRMGPRGQRTARTHRGSWLLPSPPSNPLPCLSLVASPTRHTPPRRACVSSSPTPSPPRYAPSGAAPARQPPWRAPKRAPSASPPPSPCTHEPSDAAPARQTDELWPAGWHWSLRDGEARTSLPAVGVQAASCAQACAPRAASAPPSVALPWACFRRACF